MKRFTSPSYLLAKQEWDQLALQPWMLHKQSGIKLWLVGVNHTSSASLSRVQKVIQQVQPHIVALELVRQHFCS
jgi:pheromone shutdown protein TraB